MLLAGTVVGSRSKLISDGISVGSGKGYRTQKEGVIVSCPFHPGSTMLPFPAIDSSLLLPPPIIRVSDAGARWYERYFRDRKEVPYCLYCTSCRGSRGGRRRSIVKGQKNFLFAKSSPFCQGEKLFAHQTEAPHRRLCFCRGPVPPQSSSRRGENSETDDASQKRDVALSLSLSLSHVHNIFFATAGLMTFIGRFYTPASSFSPFLFSQVTGGMLPPAAAGSRRCCC